jgi:hypothetical protein
MLNRRFPDLERAREEFFGIEKPLSPRKKIQTSDIIKLS